MIYVVVAWLGFQNAARRDNAYDNAQTYITSKATWAGPASLEELEKIPWNGNVNALHARAEFVVQADADGLWSQLVTATQANTPTAGSRMRQMDCPFDDGGSCTVVNEVLF